MRDYVGEEGESGVTGRKLMGEEVGSLEGIVGGLLEGKEEEEDGDGDIRMGD